MDKPSSGWKASVMVLVVTALLGGASWYFFSPDIQTTKQETASALAKEAAPAEKVEDRGMPLASPFGAAQVQAQTETPSVTGRWIGQLDMGSNASPAQVSFNLQATGGLLTGTATFPIGEGSIENGKITGSQLSFSTRHRLPSSSQILLTQFTGDIAQGAIALRMQTEGGENRLTIHQVSR